MSSYNKTQITEYINNIALFSNFSEEEKACIAEIADIRKYGAEEFIVKKDSTNRDLYVVLQGKVNIVEKSSRGKTQIINSIGVNQPFGEMAFLENTPRSRDVVSGGNSLLLAITWVERQDNLLKAVYGKLSTSLYKVIVSRLQNTTKQFLDDIKQRNKILEERNSLYKKLLFQSPDLIFQFSISKQGILTFPFMSK